MLTRRRQRCECLDVYAWLLFMHRQVKRLPGQRAAAACGAYYRNVNATRMPYIQRTNYRTILPYNIRRNYRNIQKFEFHYNLHALSHFSAGIGLSEYRLKHVGLTKLHTMQPIMNVTLFTSLLC